jgi:hypothetical protein
MIRFGSLAGEIYATAGALEGVALWLPPNAKWTRENIEASGMHQLPNVIGGDAHQRYREVVGRDWQAHERDLTGSCWYLFILGVEQMSRTRWRVDTPGAQARRQRAARVLSRNRESAQRRVLSETGLWHDRERRRTRNQRRPVLDLPPHAETLNVVRKLW